MNTASLKQDRRQTVTITVIFKTIATFAVAAGPVVWVSAAPSPSWMVARAVAGVVIGAAGMWAVERFGE